MTIYLLFLNQFGEGLTTLTFSAKTYPAACSVVKRWIRRELFWEDYHPVEEIYRGECTADWRLKEKSS